MALVLDAKIKEKDKGEREAKDRILSKTVPIYLCFLLVLLAFVLGLFFYHSFLREKSSYDGTILNQQNKIVDVVLVYSKDCNFCKKWNSILDSFNDRGIPFSLKKVDAASEEGRDVLKKYSIKELPTALVSYEKMHYYPKTETGISQRFERVLDKYVVYESNFNPSKYYVSIFLDKNCSNNKEVIFYDDPYSQASLKYRKVLNEFISKNKDNLNFTYVYFPLTDDYTKNKALVDLSKYLYCSAKVGNYLEFENLFRAKYCNFDDNEDFMTDQELLFCLAGGSPLKKNRDPLNNEEIKQIANKLKLFENNDFNACINNDSFADVWNSAILGYKINIRNSPIGVAVVGCKYLTNLDNLQNVFETV